MKENEVLADFIGKRRDKPSKGYEQQWELPMCEGYYPSASNLEFDKRWERLMPVWYKFRDLKMGNNKSGPLLDMYKQHIRLALTDVSIQRAFELLSEAIEWYNANKQL